MQNINDRNTLTQVIENHVKTIMTRYKGKIFHYDVVNEILDENGGLRNSVFSRVLGEDFVGIAFRAARATDPDAKLYINDYNLEWDTKKIDTTLKIVKDLQRKGVRIDGIGFQGHLGIQYDYPGDFPNIMRKFTDLGLEAAITEADVRMVLPVTPKKLATQADYYKRMLSTCAANKRCVEFTVWGFTDRHSWVPGWFEGEGAACITDDKLAPKPAYKALLTVGRR